MALQGLVPGTNVGTVAGWLSDTQRALILFGSHTVIEAAVSRDIKPLRPGTRVTLAGAEGEKRVVWILAD